MYYTFVIGVYLLKNEFSLGRYILFSLQCFNCSYFFLILHIRFKYEAAY